MRRTIVGLAALVAPVPILMAAAVPGYAAELPTSSADVPVSAAQDGDSCSNAVCYHWWGPSLSDATDQAGIDHDQRWSCNKNDDTRTIAIQVDLSDGKDEYYTVWDNVPGRACAEGYEHSPVHRFRYVAVNTGDGSIAGTPTEWKSPPWGDNPP